MAALPCPRAEVAVYAVIRVGMMGWGTVVNETNPF
jgi:hypothetical protein